MQSALLAELFAGSYSLTLYGLPFGVVIKYFFNAFSQNSLRSFIVPSRSAVEHHAAASDGAIVATGSGIGKVSTPPINVGAAKSSFGWPLSAAFIYAFQIRAGKLPPVTEFKPPIPFSDSVASSLKNAIEVASCGVYTVNQAEAFD